MPLVLDGTTGVTFPAGGLGNPASAVVGLTDTQTLTNKSVVATQLTGTVAVARLPAGSVLQVVQGITEGTAVTTTSTSFVTTGVTASITPNFSTSKILIMLSAEMRTESGKWSQTGLFKNGGVLKLINTGYHYLNGSTITTQLNYVYLDSPATTSSTTYTLYFNAQNGGTASFNPDGCTAPVVLMEISA